MLIVTGSDDNYAAGVMVLISSAAFHNPEASFVVLDMGIRPENRSRIDALATRLGVSIKRIEIDQDSFNHLSVARAHLTLSAYLRLLIPDLFPEESRAIYMDCDMVVMDDVSFLANVDLGDSIVAAVACPSPDPIEVYATGHVIGSYINSGLLVLNLPVWRREGIAAQCLALLSDRTRPLLSEDQSAINIVARGRILLLEARFNTYTDPSSYKRCGDFPDVPAVLHYVVNNKPWTMPTSMGLIWHFHADRIADLMPPRSTLSFRRRLSLLNRSRKLYLGIAMRRQKYQVRRWMLAHMNGTITHTYLANAKLRWSH